MARRRSPPDCPAARSASRWRPSPPSWRTQTGPARAWVRSRTIRSFERSRGGRVCHCVFRHSYSAMIEWRARRDSSAWPAPCRTVLLQRHAVDRIDLDPRGGRGLDEFRILDRGVEGVAQRLARARRARWARSPAACRAHRRRRSAAMTWRSSSLRASSCTDGISRSFAFGSVCTRRLIFFSASQAGLSDFQLSQELVTPSTSPRSIATTMVLLPW